MGVISVRFNEEEEKILKKMSDYFDTDRSTLIKKSLHELYENVLDLEIIEKFEDKERRGKVSFISSKDVLN